MLYNIVRGEFYQAKNYDKTKWHENYISASFYKTSSLMALSCRGVGLIHNKSMDIQRILTVFATHFGTAFQISDDILDYVAEDFDKFGKPQYNDLKEGVVSPPIIMAQAELSQTNPEAGAELSDMMARKFREEGDVEKAIDYLLGSSGIINAERLGYTHVQEAIN